MSESTASALSNLTTKPSALVAVPFDLGMPRTPESAYLSLARAMVIQALDTVLASPVLHWNVPRSLQHVSSLQSGFFRAGNSGYSGGMSEPNVAPAAAVDHLNRRTDLAPVIIVVAASTASNVSSVAFATCCSEVGAGGETGSDEDGSGDGVMDTSDSGAGGRASGITHTRGTDNSGYNVGVSGARLAPAAVVDHFNPRTDLAPVITVVAASNARM